MGADKELKKAVAWIRETGYLSAFTGAGVSVESNIPPFRGENGLWSKYDPELFEISYFRAHPKESWTLLKKLFYDTFKEARPNEAHKGLARLERRGTLKALITQNIDNLHYLAGSRNIVEYHGSVRELVCTACRKRRDADPELLERLPPLCECGGVLKPDIVFFGEEIPIHAILKTDKVIEQTEVMLVIGTTGEVFPAGLVPMEAKRKGARLIEVNVEPSNLTRGAADIFVRGKATEVVGMIEAELLG